MSSFIGGLLRKKTIPYHINGGFNGNIIYRFWVFSTPCLITRRVYVSNSPIPMNSHGFTPPHGFFSLGRAAADLLGQAGRLHGRNGGAAGLCVPCLGYDGFGV